MSERAGAAAPGLTSERRRSDRGGKASPQSAARASESRDTPRERANRGKNDRAVGYHRGQGGEGALRGAAYRRRCRKWTRADSDRGRQRQARPRGRNRGCDRRGCAPVPPDHGGPGLVTTTGLRTVGVQIGRRDRGRRTAGSVRGSGAADARQADPPRRVGGDPAARARRAGGHMVARRPTDADRQRPARSGRRTPDHGLGPGCRPDRRAEPTSRGLRARATPTWPGPGPRRGAR